MKIRVIRLTEVCDMRPFFSIIIPCYNSSPYLNKSLSCIEEIGMDDIEVVLADNCSTESYQDVVDQFKDRLNIVQCCTEYNSGGPSNGRELGASIATGKYITFQDHDDYMIPEGIRKIREIIEQADYPEYLVA